MFFNRINKQTGATWRDRLQEIKSARAEYAELEPIMTEAEKAMYSKSIGNKRAEVESLILQGAIGEYQNAIDQWHDASKRLQTAKNKEVARWEAVKLNAEMQTVESLVTKAVQSSTGGRLEPNVMPRLKAMYDEAQNSGDIYKMRAIAEVFTGLPAMVGPDFDDRKEANRLSKQAQKDARMVRITPELQAADQAAAESVQGINHAKSTLFEVDESLGDTNFNGEVGNFTIYKELLRIKSNASGDIVEIVPTDQVFTDGA